MKEEHIKQVQLMESRIRFMAIEREREAEVVQEMKQKEKEMVRENDEYRLDALKQKRVLAVYQAHEAESKAQQSQYQQPKQNPTSSQSSRESAEILRLRKELEDMESRKDTYKSWFKQSEAYADEEQEESQRLKNAYTESKAESSSEHQAITSARK